MLINQVGIHVKPSKLTFGQSVNTSSASTFNQSVKQDSSTLNNELKFNFVSDAEAFSGIWTDEHIAQVNKSGTLPSNVMCIPAQVLKGPRYQERWVDTGKYMITHEKLIWLMTNRKYITPSKILPKGHKIEKNALGFVEVVKIKED